MPTATRDHLLDAAEALVRSRGYTAFSYADLAGAVGISKPSIHHHFPTKEDLGVALVASYTERFDACLARIVEATLSASARLHAYADLYLEGLRDERACLCAMLASNHAAVPERIRIGAVGFHGAEPALAGAGDRGGTGTGRTRPRAGSTDRG
jgi:TetR/AcrR family transcriptional repressor of nem operon